MTRGRAPNPDRRPCESPPRPGAAGREARAAPRRRLPAAAGRGPLALRDPGRPGESEAREGARRHRGAEAPPPGASPIRPHKPTCGDPGRVPPGAGSSPNTRVPAALTDQHAQHVEQHEDPPPLHAAPAPGRARDPRRQSQRVPSRPGQAAGSHGRGARPCQGGAGRGGEGRGAAGRGRSSPRGGGGLCPRPVPPRSAGRGEPGGARWRVPAWGGGRPHAGPEAAGVVCAPHPPSAGGRLRLRHRSPEPPGRHPQIGPAGSGKGRVARRKEGTKEHTEESARGQTRQDVSPGFLVPRCASESGSAPKLLECPGFIAGAFLHA